MRAAVSGLGEIDLGQSEPSASRCPHPARSSRPCEATGPPRPSRACESSSAAARRTAASGEPSRAAPAPVAHAANLVADLDLLQRPAARQTPPRPSAGAHVAGLRLPDVRMPSAATRRRSSRARPAPAMPRGSSQPRQLADARHDACLSDGADSPSTALRSMAGVGRRGSKDRSDSARRNAVAAHGSPCVRTVAESRPRSRPITVGRHHSVRAELRLVQLPHAHG